MFKIILRNIGIAAVIGLVMLGIVYLAVILEYVIDTYFAAYKEVAIGVVISFFVVVILIYFTVDMERFYRRLDEKYPTQPPRSQKYKDNPEELESFMTDLDRSILETRKRGNI